MDAFRRDADGTDRGGMDTFHGKAFDVLTSSKLVEALDVTKEPVACAIAMAAARRSTWATARRCGTINC